MSCLVLSCLVDAWIITGGTNSGVAKYVGQEVARQQKRIPTIGIIALKDLKPEYKLHRGDVSKIIIDHCLFQVTWSIEVDQKEEVFL